MTPDHLPCDATQQIATLSQMFGEPQHPERVDIQKAHDAYRDAYQAMQEDAVEAGLETHGNSRLWGMFFAGLRFADTWERRTKALETVLRDVLASDTANDTQRAVLLRALLGKKVTGRDPKLLTEVEATLIAQYRDMLPADRQMLRALLARLAEKGDTK